MSYPKNVYHKDFDGANATEATLKTHSKVVHSDEELKKLGSDWGDHPSVKGRKTSKATVDPTEFLEVEPVKEKVSKKVK